MNDPQKLKQEIDSKFDDISVTIDEPEDPAGLWHVDVRFEDLYVVVEWRPDGRGFFLSTPELDVPGSGVENYPNVYQLLDRISDIASLLTVLKTLVY